MDALEAREIDVGVNLRGADAGVAEHFLHLAQVGAAGQQVRGETVAQSVRAHAGRRADAEGIEFDELPNAFAAQAFAAWEAAVCWDDAHSKKRLAEVRAG